MFKPRSTWLQHTRPSGERVDRYTVREEIAGTRVRQFDEYAAWRAKLLRDARAHGAFDLIDRGPETRF